MAEKNEADDFDLLGTSKRDPTNFNASLTSTTGLKEDDSGRMIGDLMSAGLGEDEAKRKRQEEYENFQKQREEQRKKLMEILEEERRMTKENKPKVLKKWRDHQRGVLTEDLRNQLEILIKQMEDQLMRHSDLIKESVDDLHGLEQQFRSSQRSHIHKMDVLFDIHEKTLNELNNQFEYDLRDLKKEFHSERDYILTQQNQQMKAMQSCHDEVETRSTKKLKENLQFHEAEREEIKNHNLEDFNVTKMTLEGKLEKKEKLFDNEHTRYIELTEDKNNEYIALKNTEKELSKEIDGLMEKNDDLQYQVTKWKKKISGNAHECKERNQALKIEKDLMNEHYRELKNEMTKFRESESDRLSELTTQARKATSINRQYLEQLEQILRITELCRKHETEKEIVLKIEELDHLPECDIANDRPRDTALFENFWKKYNKVLLDKRILEKQKQELSAENQQLSECIQQYISGISVTKETLDAEDNCLLVVNGKISMKRENAVEPHLIVVEGNNVVRKYSKQAH